MGMSEQLTRYPSSSGPKPLVCLQPSTAQASPAPRSQRPRAAAGTMCPCCGTSASPPSGWPPFLEHKQKAMEGVPRRSTEAKEARSTVLHQVTAWIPHTAEHSSRWLWSRFPACPPMELEVWLGKLTGKMKQRFTSPVTGLLQEPRSQSSQSQSCKKRESCQAPAQ